MSYQKYSQQIHHMPGLNNNLIISLVINSNCHNSCNRYELVDQL